MTNPPQFPGDQPPPGQPYGAPGPQQPGQPYGAPGPQQPRPQFGGYQQPPQQPGGFPQPPQQFGGYPQPPQKQGMSTGAKIVIALLVVVFIFIAGCVGLVAVAGQGFSNAIEDFAEEAERNGDILEENATLTNCRIDQFGRPTVTVAVTNPFPEEKGFLSVEVNFLDGPTVVGSGSVTFNNLAPGQSAVEEATSFDTPEGVSNITCEVADATVL